MNDAQLINDFVTNGSETAFRSLVERHLPLVLGTARRITAENALAEEIAQTVFILLARKARSFGPGTIVSGWLYRTTCFVAARAMRGEQRRKRREQEAAAMQIQDHSNPSPHAAVPHLDDALQRLNRTDRDALLLRFCEELPLRNVGSSLGLTEEAARKRVARALEKLRRLLGRRGTEITAAALAASLTQQTANAGVTSAGISQITAAALAPAANSALLADVLAAWRWTKLKIASGVGSVVIATAFLLSQAFPTAREMAADDPPEPASARRAESNTPDPVRPNERREIAGQAFAAQSLRITVLDVISGDPIARAELTHSLMGERPDPLHTDTDGTVTIPVPEHVPDGGRMHQFEAWIKANNYAPRTVIWLSSTGGVLNLVSISNQYTVRLESGCTVSGTVVDENGQPLTGVRVTASGYNNPGYSIGVDESGAKITSPPILRVEDFARFSTGSATDRDGHFQFSHYPTDLKAVVLGLVGTDGARRSFRTSQVKLADQMTEVRFDELLTGSARLVLPRGITLEGVVVSASGEPVAGATVIEGTQWGSFRVLSRNETDQAGHFWLSNRQPGEIILAASAAGHGSASVTTWLKQGIKPVTLHLPPERPLRGRVLNETGEAIADAAVQLASHLNEGLGLDWSDKTDREGRFVWNAAPTNEVALSIISHATYPLPRLVFLSPSTNEHVIVLPSSQTDAVRVTGTATNSATAQAIDRFTVKVAHSLSSGIPERFTQTIQGSNGLFELNTSKSEVAPGNYPAWLLLIEADGYDSIATRFYDFAEGDQALHFQMVPGGVVEGTLRTPAGEPAAGSQVAVIPLHDSAPCPQPGKFSLWGATESAHTDAQGHFKLRKPVTAGTLIAFHESGWTAVPVPSKSSGLEIPLLPWARIEGDLMSGETPVAGESISICELLWDPACPIAIRYRVTTDDNGHFVFEKLPAGEYQVSLTLRSGERASVEIAYALQTPVAVAAGESRHIRLGDTGQKIVATLRPPRSATAPDWQNTLATLSRDVALPAHPTRNESVSNDSHSAATTRFAHDPAVRAAYRQVRNYVGQIASDGTVTFENVPPGKYVLEVKTLSPRTSRPASPSLFDKNIVARLRVPVAVPSQTGNADAPVAIGTFALYAE